MEQSTESNVSHEIVRYRHKSDDSLQLFFYGTGYCTSFLSRRAQNQENSPIFRLSDDVLLDIVCYLGYVELYCVRQVSSRFASIFASHNRPYATQHRQKAGKHNLGRPRYQRVQQTGEPHSNDSGSLTGAHEPIVKFNQSIISAHQKDSIRDLLRLDVCDECLPGAYFRPYGGKGYPLQKPCTGYCKKSLVNVDDVPPRLLRTSKDRVMATWKLTVCTLKSNQVVTKDLLKQGLAQLQPHNDYLCPHTDFEDSFLLRPFDTSRCLCFRTTSASNACPEHSPPMADRCCICRDDFDNLAGRFMADCDLDSHHTARCVKCVATYRWTLEGNKVMLAGTRAVSEMEVVQDAKGKPEARLTPKVVDLPLWLKSLDPNSYEGNEDTWDYNTCKRDSCQMSRRKGLPWYI
ncbi:hypothetical protein CKAH01_06187 [Colletotrichum kahawae]|uniref:F-box domain-containing protein n=1 Tax=Colletotrichum kahawae TaxID=34407 RepID=A0AAD9Y9M7_COLKA|nr:hypothetical protein CKAH01_06187 [Colletotrichum kahawae]